MTKPEETVELFANGLNCSQAMLSIFGRPYGLDSDMAIGLGRALGGGMGHMARTCGAVTAAVIVLGLARDDEEEAEARNASFSRAQELFRRFEKLHGTSECKNLLGADMSTEEGIKKIREEQLVKKLCPAYVRDAAMILDDLLKP